MELVKVKLPVHQHKMTPLKDGRMCNCCGIKSEAVRDGYYCEECDYFFHNTCTNPSNKITYPDHHKCGNIFYRCHNIPRGIHNCDLCREKLMAKSDNYWCFRCRRPIFHLDCARYPPPEDIEVPHNHDHKLKLEKKESFFTCADCGKRGQGYSYKCHECVMTFHVSCKKHAAEVNHPSHSLHPLKLVKGIPPTYTDGKCRLCGKKILDEIFYHCSTCNFTLDLHCVFHPPQHFLEDLNFHDHKLTLMPKSISFTCTTCGLSGDRSPYVCLQCDFTAHNDCCGLPWVIYINRHDHRVFRTSLIGVVDAVCGICRKRMDWSCGGYACKKCPKAVYHAKCATRKDVWDGKEMKDEPEEDEDFHPFEVTGENTIQHFSHKEHNLRLDESGIFIEGRNCKACAYPIYHDSFYNCMNCKDGTFLLHESCANMPTRKRHMVSTEKYILYTSDHIENSECLGCGVTHNGFKYGNLGSSLDVRGLCMRCASISEPFEHQSHAHPLFYTSPKGVCSACNEEAHHVLRCVEDNCGYVLDFKCALLPYKVKHRVDDHFLSLCYGENANGIYWCDICEKKTDPKTWFYTCKDCGVSLHLICVLGDSRALMPDRHMGPLAKAVRNNSMSRPHCKRCKALCIFPLLLKPTYNKMHDIYCCSVACFDEAFPQSDTWPKDLFCLGN